MSTAQLIVAAFVAGAMFGAAAGVLALSIARAATDPKLIRAENQRDRRVS